jgi:hypothetical protein
MGTGAASAEFKAKRVSNFVLRIHLLHRLRRHLSDTVCVSQRETD